MRSHLNKDQAVQSWDACKPGDECQHCAADRPEAPESAGDPADTAGNTWEVETDAQRYALPPTYHRPEWLDTLQPPGWFCAACWDEGQITGWPCLVATRHGSYISQAIREERDAQRPKPTCTCCGTSWPHVPSSERCAPAPAVGATSEQVTEFRHIVSEHHGYVPADFAADCLSAVLGVANQAATDTRPKPTCGHCGGLQDGYAAVGNTPLCHPDTGMDCFKLVTLYGHGAPCSACKVTDASSSPEGGEAQ